MKREDFVCTIGFQGEAAIVDGASRKRYGKKRAEELLEEGLYRYAFCAALFDDELETFLEQFRRVSGIDVADTQALKRIFGVYDVPTTPGSVKVIS